MTTSQKHEGTSPRDHRAEIDTSHYGLIRQLNEYADSEGSNQSKIHYRLCDLLEKVNPGALSAIRNAVRPDVTGIGGPVDAEPQGPNLTTCVNMLPRYNPRVYEVLEALENAIQ